MSSALATAPVARGKSPEAFRTISEVSLELDVPQHVLRFWETRFACVRPVKRAGGRRFYRPEDVALLRGIRSLLYADGYTIKGVQKVLRDRGHRFVAELGRKVAGEAWSAAGSVGDEDTPHDELPVVRAPAEARPKAAMAVLMRVHADAEKMVAMDEHNRIKLELLLAELLVLRDRLRGAVKLRSGSA
jgi:DNA-binding transcriptional MerR regulator